ncbi:MAG: 5-oxoprolinase [Acidiferrobacteraceae bacterium]|nr:5-oxoprolinase [Acidiferrobacteraceae bacterium]
MNRPKSNSNKQTTTSQADPITVEVIRNSFSSIAAQMNQNLARSAYTPIIYEMKDCSVSLFDRNIQLVGQSSGLPVFLGTLGPAVEAVVDTFGIEDMSPGDVYLLNDSYIVGSHLNDVSVLSPIFLDSMLIGFGASKAHWMDIGAKSPSSATDSTEIYQEGYRLGPTRVFKKGIPEKNVIDFLTRNSRLPKAIWGDLQAQVAACRTGEREMAKLYQRFGLEIIDSASEQIFDQSEIAERAAVAALPDGTWQSAGNLDSWGPGGEIVPVVTTVTITGDQMHVSLEGSSPQTPGCLNCGLQQTIAGIRLAYKFVIEPGLPITAGSFRNLTVTVPERSVFDAREPAACQHYYPHIGLMIDLFLNALSNAAPEAVIAGQPGDAMNIMLTGKQPSTGELFVSGEATGVGWGAFQGGDGSNGMITYGGGDLKNFPIEVQEHRFPIRIHEYSLRPNSGGLGKWRGGLGLIRRYETLSEARLSTWFERTQTPGRGLFGGESGEPAMVTVDDGQETWSALKCADVPIPAGTKITVATGGGGGFGPTHERSEHDIENDTLMGYTTQ